MKAMNYSKKIILLLNLICFSITYSQDKPLEKKTIYLSSYGVAFNNNYTNFSFPNAHLKTLFRQWFGKENYIIDSRGFYGGLFGTFALTDENNSKGSSFGLRVFYLLQPAYERFLYYPVFQVGYDQLSDDFKIRTRIGGGVSYRIIGGISVNAELGTGIAPFLLGFTFSTNRKTVYAK